METPLMVMPYANNDTFSLTEGNNEDTNDTRDHCASGDLTGVVGLFVQALLAFLAFTSLILKRFCEPKHSRRPWLIWFFDTSKQGVGAAVLHFANLFLSDIFQGDPCTWYFISFLLDSTIGLLVIWIGLKTSQIVSRRHGWKSLSFGEYGDPPKCNAWIGQCALYILVMVVTKMLMTPLLLFRFWSDCLNATLVICLSYFILKVKKFLMSPIRDPTLEIVLVMFIVPVVVNAIVFWVVDNFLKHSIQSSDTIYIQAHDKEASVKYFHDLNAVKCYSRIQHTEENDCEMLLPGEEDGDLRQRNSDPHHRLIS